MIDFSPEERNRYQRHLILPEIGEAGQRKLKEASVLLVGTGGLGSASSLYLAAAGVGRIGLVDFDVVDVSNLHRQIVHGESTRDQKKVDSAKSRLLDINPHIEVVTYDCKLDASNALEIVKDYDVVADGTDNFATRYLVNDACVLSKKPNIYASVHRFEGQVSVFDAQRGPCYRCLFPYPPPAGAIPSCAEGGVLGILPGVVGTLQATEVIKYVVGVGESLLGRLLTFDALSMSFSSLTIAKDPKCHACGPNANLLLRDEAFVCESIVEISQVEVEALMRTQRVRFVDVREPHEWANGIIEDAMLMPLGEVEYRCDELDKAATIVAYCKSGVRSREAARALNRQGFRDVRSLRGGYSSSLRTK